MDMNREKNSSKNMDSLSEFIREHYGDDPDRLALQKAKWPGIDVAAAVSTLLSRRKLAGKAPLWAETEGLVLPRTLSAEQCSSEIAARHKALVIKKMIGRGRIADLTGGLGVDCLEFGKIAEAVLYNEMLPELAAAAEHNFRVLEAGNIEVCNFEASLRTLGDAGDMKTDAGNKLIDAGDMKTDTGDMKTEAGSEKSEKNDAPGGLRKRLEAFRPDVIFLDPARRDGCGKKVFLLEDCSPDILKIKDLLLDIAPIIVLKLSPMADIAMLLERLGPECSEVQIIEAGGECKELIVTLKRCKNENNPSPEPDSIDGRSDSKHIGADDCPIKIYKLRTGKTANDSAVSSGPDMKDSAYEDPIETDAPAFEFCRKRENACEAPILAEMEDLRAGALLFEPGKALMKAGCFKLLAKSLNGKLLGRDAHYYIVDSTAPNDLKSLGKTFKIIDTAPLSGKSMKEFSRRHPEAEVTARGVRMTSEELRRRLGCKPSDRHHIFALHVDKTGKNLLLFTERI